MLSKIPFPTRITLLYIIFGALWILFSDRLVISFTSDPQLIQELSTIKGWLFVAVTGLLLFYLVRNEIRKRNQIVTQLREAKEKADEADRLKTTFLCNLSHYIRTPMNSILGFIELIEDKDTSAETHQVFLNYINESSQSLLQTLTSIIEIAKIQEGHVSINNQSIGLNSLVERAVNLARAEIAEKKKAIEVIPMTGLPVGKDTAFSDPDKIFLILSSVVSNSVQYTSSGEIQIGYSASENGIRFWVKDTGPGIPENRVGTIFDNFLQTAEYTRSAGEGTGLGLALSAMMAKLLHGTLWVETTGKEGTTICLSIPQIITGP